MSRWNPIQAILVRKLEEPFQSWGKPGTWNVICSAIWTQVRTLAMNRVLGIHGRQLQICRSHCRLKTNTTPSLEPSKKCRTCTEILMISRDKHLQFLVIMWPNKSPIKNLLDIQCRFHLVALVETVYILKEHPAQHTPLPNHRCLLCSTILMRQFVRAWCTTKN